MANLINIEGVGETYTTTLRQAGIGTTGQLLDKGATPQGRKAIAEQTGLSPKLILGWVNRVDLLRVKGVGEEYADLLEKAGVDTVPELPSAMQRTCTRSWLKRTQPRSWCVNCRAKSRWPAGWSRPKHCPG